MFDGQGRRKYLNEAERRAFLRAVEQETDPLRRSFCLVLFYTGCRISEALGVTGSRIDVAQKSIVFETLKRRRRGVFRAVPVPDELVRLLEELSAPPDGRVWPFSRTTRRTTITVPCDGIAVHPFAGLFLLGGHG